MNVWIVNHYAIPPSMGGLVRHYYFSKYLQKNGHTVKIFTSSKIHNTDINMIRDKSLYKEEIVDGIEYTFVKSRDYKGNGLQRILNMVELPFQMWKTMKLFFKKEKPDVIYTSSPDLFVAFFALVFGRKKKIPVVVEVHDLWPESIVEYKRMSRKNPVIQVLYQLEKWIYKKADRLIFTMPGGKEYIKDKGWDKAIDLRKVHHINNGVDLEEFEYNKRNNHVCDEDLESNDKKIVYVGSIRLANNLGQLIKAAKVLKEKHRDDIKFLIYGDGTEKEQLEKFACEENLNVVFKGKVEKKYIPYILSKADVNIINVKNTGLTKYGCSWNKLFEYIASENPIVCNFPQKYDLINEYHLGKSEKFASSRDYAKRIKELVDITEEERRVVRENAKQLKKEYDYQYLTTCLEKIFSNVVGEK